MARPATGSIVERRSARGTTYAVRFRAYGERQFVTLGDSADGWTRAKAEAELANVLADVRRGLWRPPTPEPQIVAPIVTPTFHEYASAWLALHRSEFAPRTVEDYELSLRRHLLPFFAPFKLGEITAQAINRYKAEKVAYRDELAKAHADGKRLDERALSNRTINKTLTRLGQILDAALEDDLIDHNPMRGKVKKLKEAPPQRARMQGEQVQTLLRCAGRNRALLATAIMAGGLRVSELTHLRWRDVDLRDGVLNVEVSKTDAGRRQVALEDDLVRLLREHRVASKWSREDDFVFPGRDRKKPRERNSVRTRVLYPAIKRANEVLASNGRPLIADGVTFHALRRTYAALRAELGEHPAITAAQMGHVDPRMTLRVYTDVTGMRPTTRMAGLLADGADWAQMGTNRARAEFVQKDESPAPVAELRR